jgi:hypothetical protein
MRQSFVREQDHYTCWLSHLRSGVTLATRHYSAFQNPVLEYNAVGRGQLRDL